MIDTPEFDPLPNVGSQIERAIAALAVECGFGSEDQNFVTNDNRTRKIYDADGNAQALNTYLAHKFDDRPDESGIEIYQVTIESEFPATNQSGGDAAWNWKQINLWVGQLRAMMSLRNDGERDFKATADLITAAGRDLAVDHSNGTDPIQKKSAADNADMIQFTCQKVVRKGGLRAGKTPDGALIFLEQRYYEIHAVPYNSD